MQRVLIAIIALFIFISCDNDNKKIQQAIRQGMDSLFLEEPIISDEVISEIIQQVPSPLETASQLKRVGKKYNKAFLNTPENVAKYNNSFKKSINLGVYGADLGYCNIYEQNQDALLYLNSVKDLADDLMIGQFFDIETIRRLATNSTNIDSLLLITTKNFNQINRHLQNQKRSNLSILILTGGWIEALNITCRVIANDYNNEVLKERIGEQKITLDNLLLLLSFYGNTDPNIKDLIEDLTMLQGAFSKVEIVTHYQKPKRVIEDGIIRFEDQSTSETNVTTQNIKEISRLTNELRDKIIN